MKLICLQENLNQGLNIARVAISKNTTLPIVNNFLLEAKNNQLVVIATNLEIGIETIIRGKIEKEGIITIPAATLAGFIGSLPNKKINLEVNNSILSVTCEGFKAKLNGISADDFPSIPKTQEEQSISVAAEALKMGLTQVISAASTSDIRPELAGVFIKVEGDKIILAATDSFRLAEKIIKLDKNYKLDYKVILPTRTVVELNHILDEDENIQIFRDQNQVLFKIGATKLTSRVVEAEYPDYPQIIPKSSDVKIVVNKQELVKSVKIAGIFANTRVNDVRLTLKGEKLTIQSNTPEIGENSSEIDVVKSEGAGPETEIIYNYHSLLDGLNNIYSDEVTLELNGDIGPTILRPVGQDDYLYITKPLKIN